MSVDETYAADGSLVSSQARSDLPEVGIARQVVDGILTDLSALRAYRDLASPTNAQTAAAVKVICRVLVRIVRLQLRRYDAVD